MNCIKITWLYMVIVLTFVINLFPVEARAEKKIGVLMFSEETRYHESLQGIMDQLNKSGFVEPAVRYIIINAGGSKVKSAEAVQRFASEKMDLIITLGTTATIAAAKEIKDVPIIFSMVFDPIEARIAKGWKSSGNNTTGASAKIPMSKLIDYLKDFSPVKKLAVLYTPGEKNSEAQLKELLETQATEQVKIIPVIMTKKEEITQTLPEVARSVDAIYLSGSSIVGSSVPSIVAIANKAKVVTITHLDDLVDKGVLLAACPSPYRLGTLAGKKAVQVLKGVKPSAIPIEADKQLDLILNRKTAKAGQFQIPPSFMKKVTKNID